MNSDEYAETLPSNLKNEISLSERLRVEFKESYAEADEIRATMIAFANAVGGRIYVGIKEVGTKSGLRIGQIVGVTKPGISDASSNARQWAGSFIPKLDVSFKSYQADVNRVDVIEVKESTQKPVCSSSGLYKIRSSDGNTGIDPARLRQMIVGYEAFKSALMIECEQNLMLLQSIYKYAAANPPQSSLNELDHSTIDAILTNGALSSFFDIRLLTRIRQLCAQMNKLLNFAITAGGVVFEAKVFYEKIIEIHPILKKQIGVLRRKLS